ncbi:ScbR family autoregulator-binding transcription factor [Streptomyces sp. NPDC001339]|uniref:ScbR family autoregulator-binding transcription factor n=1 Tax=Streptomyces sp. NPDC001339 TaxID=3364563 RepID=UPI0036BEF4AB
MATQERAIQTRRTVLEAAAAVFGEYGYERASLAEILKRAGVTKGALYFHFPSKEALALAVINEQTHRSAPSPTEKGLQAAIDLTHDVAHALGHDVLLQAGIRLTIEGSFDSPVPAPYHAWSQRCVELFTEGKDRGEVLPQVVPEEVAELLVGSFTGIQLLSQVLTGRVDLPERITKLWRYLLPGIAAPGALAHLKPEGTETSGARGTAQPPAAHRPRKTAPRRQAGGRGR